MENKDLIVKEENQTGLFAQPTSKMFCSKVAETTAEKKSLINALEQCDLLLNNCVGQVINMKDIYCEQKQVVDDQTGEIKNKYRTIIFDDNGQTYATGSYGIYNILKKIMQVYGMPTWDEPVQVKVTKRPIKDGKSTLSLELL